MRPRYVVGLDIGTTKVCAVVGLVSGGSSEVIGVGLSPSSGMKKGVVVDMDATAEAISKALKEAELESGVELNAAHIGIAGAHVRCVRSSGAIGIKGKVVTREDVDNVIESASAMYVPLDREVLHVMPSEFVIDDQDGILEPVGMSGFRLEAEVNVITSSQAAVENLVRCCERAGVKVVDVIFEPMASCLAVVSPEEMDSGALLVDMGGGTTDIALYMDGKLKHAAALPVGGYHFTNDIAVGLKVSHAEAERLKRAYASAVPFGDQPEEIAVEGMDRVRRTMPLRYLADIVTPRCEEVLQLLKKEVENSELYEMPSCVVLSGGVSIMKGIDRFAEAALGLPVRVGAPENAGGLRVASELCSPQYATAVGLLLSGIRHERGLYDEVRDRVLDRLGALKKYMFTYAGVGFGLGSGRSHAH